MDIIEVKLLGNPIVTYHNEIIHFPYKKAEGLFFYVCINKSITREEAINIFWLDCEEAQAKKNLRDALYKIRKIFGEEIFLPTNKSIIAINQSCVNIDTDNICQSNIINIYKGDFLSNFVVKDCYDFEQWTFTKRQEYKDIYTKKISSMLIDMINLRDLNRIQLYSQILIDNDPYNEKTYRDIMKLYTLNGSYNMAIKLYFDLCRILKNDLGIEPEANTKNMYKEILSLKDAEAPVLAEANYFYGRFNEIYKVTSSVNDFYNNRGTSVLVSGEAGIGKTAFINKIDSLIDKNKLILFSSTCYNAEKDFFLKPWHSIFTALGEYVKKEKIHISSSSRQIISYVFPHFNDDNNSSLDNSSIQIDTSKYRIANEAIIELLQKITCNKKIVFMFDDLQWMDEMSKILLNNILFKLGNSNVLLIAAYRDDYDDIISSFKIPLMAKGLLSEISLNRFTIDEVKEIINHKLPQMTNNIELLDKIYKSTEGNALFLVEVIKAVKEKGYSEKLSLKAENIIKSRIINLSKDEKSILNAISIFFDKAEINSLQLIVNYDEFRIYEIIETLQSKHLINEIIEKSNVFYAFTHQKIREYVYDSQSMGKKIMMHKKIAESFERNFIITKNPELYSKLIYHFEKSENKLKTLQYKIEYIKEFYTVYNETFPIISYDANIENNFTTILADEKGLLELYNQIEGLNAHKNIELTQLKMEIAFILGRFYISKGEYDSGLKCINTSIGIALSLQNTAYILLNYKQIIFYCIQVHNLSKMREYIDRILEIIDINKICEESGTILRLEGLYYIKTKDYIKAKKLLEKSIAYFNSINNSNNRYCVSIAACYNYLGQMNKYLENYNEAYKYFMKAIETNKNNYSTNGMGIFYSNAGQALYRLGNYKDSYTYITKSIDFFKRNNALWGRDIAECYAAMLEEKLENKDKAYEHLQIAKELGNKIANPITLGLISQIEKKDKSI